jgi:hypothetical protein
MGKNCNEDIYNLGSTNTIHLIISTRMKSVGHVARMLFIKKNVIQSTRREEFIWGI